MGELGWGFDGDDSGWKIWFRVEEPIVGLAREWRPRASKDGRGW